MAKFNQPGDGPTPEVLLVEGPDDYHFFGHFRRLHGLDGIFRIEDGKGVPNILATLTTRLRADNENHIGIVLDADFTNFNGGVAARWNALTYAFNEAGYKDIPKRPETTGTILIQSDRPIAGVWLMPDNVEDGTLESFVSTIRMAGEHLWQKAVASVDEIPAEERLFGESVSAGMKAKVHTWLAWQEEPGTPLGQALTKTYLNVNAPRALLLAEWLRRLFATQI